jgi:S-DNA-T family DNA segregation ATPase FtsK/SpoIIIE
MPAILRARSAISAARFGAWIADLEFFLIGVVAYTLPILLLVVGAVVLRGATTQERSPLEPALRLIGFVAFFVAAPGLAWLNWHGTERAAGRQRRRARARHRQRADAHPFGPARRRAVPARAAADRRHAGDRAVVVQADGHDRPLPARRRRRRPPSKMRKAEDWNAAREARAEREVVRKVETVKQSKREPVKIEPVIAPDRKKRARQARDADPAVHRRLQRGRAAAALSPR